MGAQGLFVQQQLAQRANNNLPKEKAEIFKSPEIVVVRTRIIISGGRPSSGDQIRQ